MRKILGKLGSAERHTFQANFGKYGYKRYHDPSRGDLYSATMVVRNVEIVDDPTNPKPITDHLWLNLTKGFANLGLLKTGDRIQFNGRVAEYNKGFINKDKVDYELSYPTKIKLLNSRKVQPLPTDHQIIIGMIMNLNYKFYHNSGRPLVPYFMDAFAAWQNKQEKPLPIKCHKGNAYESDSQYETIDYAQEENAFNKAKQARKELLEQRKKAGVTLLKTQPNLVKDLISLSKQEKQKSETNSNQASAKYCYISNSKLSEIINKYNLTKTDQIKIKQALTSDWFHQQFDEPKQMSPLEQLANKFNNN